MSGTRILAGELRGHFLGSVPPSIFARPILARIKKSVFDILSPKLKRCYLLDLFAGSGNVGLEAISRGASHVTFIDLNPKCTSWIHKSIEQLKPKHPHVFKQCSTQIYCANVLEKCRFLNLSYDIIFSGAPYVDQKKRPLDFVEKLLILITAHKLLKPNGLFVAQHSKREKFSIPTEWTLYRQEEYGDTTVSFFKILDHTLNT